MLLLQAKLQAPGISPDASVFDLLVGRGPIMWPLLACSVVAVTYMVERAIRLRRKRLLDGKLGKQVIDAAREGDVPRGLELCRKSETPAARVLETGLVNADRPFLESEKAVEDAGAREVKRLSGNLRPLVVIAGLAPLLGLLGTVIGMIDCFLQVGLKSGIGKPELLAAGISEALVTTAAGLAIAIPSQAAYYYFRARIERFARDTEEVYAQVRDALRGGRVVA